MQGLNTLLRVWFNSFFEFVGEDPLPEIRSLNYDKCNNKIVIGVFDGFWVISENKRGEVRGVFHEE